MIHLKKKPLSFWVRKALICTSANSYQTAELTLGFGPKVERRLKQHDERCLTL